MAKYYLGEQQYSDSTIKPIEGIEGKIISLVDKTSEFKTIDDLKKHLLEENKIKNLNVNLYYLTKNKNEYVVVNNRKTVVLKDNKKFYHFDTISEIFINNYTNLKFMQSLFNYYMKYSKTIYKLEAELKSIATTNPDRLFDMIHNLDYTRLKPAYINIINETSSLYYNDAISKIKLLDSLLPVINHITRTPIVLADLYEKYFADQYKIHNVKYLSKIVNNCYNLTTTNGFEINNKKYEEYKNMVNMFVIYEVHGGKNDSLNEDYKTTYTLGNFLEDMFGTSYEPMKLTESGNNQMNLFTDFNLSTDEETYNVETKKENADETFYREDESDEELLTKEDFERVGTTPEEVGYTKR